MLRSNNNTVVRNIKNLTLAELDLTDIKSFLSLRDPKCETFV